MSNEWPGKIPVKCPHSYCDTNCVVPVEQVEYQCDGFLEKNKDTVNEEQINVLKASKVRSTHTYTLQYIESRSWQDLCAESHLNTSVYDTKYYEASSEIKAKKPAARGKLWHLVYCSLTKSPIWSLREAAPSAGHVETVLTPAVKTNAPSRFMIKRGLGFIYPSQTKLNIHRDTNTQEIRSLAKHDPQRIKMIVVHKCFATYCTL